MKHYYRISTLRIVLIMLFSSLFSGLLKAQQYAFQTIGLEQGMPSARINDFLQDSRGFFWLATEGAGLVRYDGFEFKTYTSDNPRVKPLITSICEDTQGNIWAASDQTLLKYDGKHFSYFYLPSNDRITTLNCVNGKLVVAGEHQLYVASHGDTLISEGYEYTGSIRALSFSDQILVATDQGLYRNETLLLEGNWNSVETLEDGRVLASGSRGLWALASRGKQQLVDESLSGLAVSGSEILGLRQDGLLILKEGGQEVFNTSNGLPQQRYKGCYLSNSGVIWLYSNTGLVKLENRAVRFYNEEQDFGPEVFSVYDDGSEVIAGTKNGVSIIKNGNAVYSSKAKYASGVVLALARYQGDLWLGTETGLVRYNGIKYEEVSLPPETGGYIFALMEAKDALWIGTGAGIYRLKDNQITNITSRQQLPISPVYAISEGEDGSLWFATYTAGFMRFYNGKWENVNALGGLKLDSLRFNSFSAKNASELWLGTLAEGVFHLSNDKVQNIGPRELNFAEVRAIDISDDGSVWLSSNKGLTEIIPHSEGYKVKDLLRINNWIKGGFSPQALSVKNRRVVAGSPEGLLIIDLDALNRYVEPPQLALTDIQLFYGEVEGLNEYASGVQSFYEVPIDLELPHDLNFLSFTLAGLTGYQPENLSYRYRMMGISENWTLAGSRREAVFANLKPGRYTFEAQVSRDGEDWSTQKLSYQFEVLTPIYQRWWFIALLCLLIGILTYLFVTDRVKRANQQLRLENSLLEMERKALRLQMNPHFIFNALDSISSFIFKNDPQQAVRYLNNFAKLMRLTLESSMEHLHPVETEVSILKNYLELEKLRFQGKFDYTIEVDDEIDYDVGIPPMLIQPHVENAILHGLKPLRENGEIHIRFMLNGEFLICEVEDNGIGRKKAREMPKRQDHRSMATQINRDRIRLLRLSMSDEIDIEIIDKENPTGTKVVIKLPAESI